MKLRRLEEKDAPLMLEWMHDDDVVHDLATDFANKAIEDCRQFVKLSIQNEKHDVHRAIVDDDDVYMGTVSLKHIQEDLSYAEFAITIRKCAMGKEYSSYAMKEIIRIAKEDLHIRHVIWCVSKENHRAVKFYNKMGYHQIYDVPDALLVIYQDMNDTLYWYEN